MGRLTRRPLHTLSGGQLQRRYLARAIGCVAAGAEVPPADEPTAALDFDGQAEAADVLTSLSVTLVGTGVILTAGRPPYASHRHTETARATSWAASVRRSGEAGTHPPTAAPSTKPPGP